MNTEVIVVGAGPTGLMLAAELGLAGIDTVVLDRLAEPTGQSKAGSLQPRSAEVLDLRGLLDHLSEADRSRPGGHFAGLPVALDNTPWQTRHPNPVTLPQVALERLLADRLAELGVPVLRGHELVDLTQDDDGVTAGTRGPDGESRLRGRYLVGCDGAHSSVRKLAGFAFPGKAGTMSAVAADIEFAATSDLVPTGQRFFGDYMRRGGGYWTLLHPLGDGAYRMIFGNAERRDRHAPVTDAEVQAALHTVYGPETTLARIRHASRFSDANRQVERYRSDRVLLAGDAAHIHLPAGGQGVNLGLQDAFNLGWKLAAQLRGWASDGLLDTYHDERHPVGARVLRNAAAQSVFMGIGEGTEVAALREVVTELVTTPDGNRYISGMMSALDLRYDMPDAPAHELLGRRMPDVDLVTDAGPTRFSRLAGHGGGVLLDLGAGIGPAASAQLGGRVGVVPAEPVPGVDASAVLVRPDGHVCWAGDDVADGLDRALARWFGQPAR
ncbi:monooxygenase [Solihabitans fulvus]|uniref:Monooxygenase n=1 Tax=Solihabitans fulvus TaxID=1892852 RepID=A0A5B2WSH3_9PSEU|nr:FAD-dependent monooxygenase [Solihabitans fulvus]KAA2253884.1 monooxygenase [Solihabitans fulvus]